MVATIAFVTMESVVVAFSCGGMVVVFFPLKARFMLLPAYINCPYDFAFFCFRCQCCLDKASAGTDAEGKPKIKRVEATSNTGIFY
jgi:hypothetical protein